MNPTFRRLVEGLEPCCRELMNQRPCKVSTLPARMPARGIYLFSHRGDPLYVGRSNQLRKRLQSHCRPSSSHFSASFAFRIARLQTGTTNPTYRRTGSRTALAADGDFRRAFERAKERVAALEIRFVEETDPVRQALLEIYVATVLRTPYNEFDNH